MIPRLVSVFLLHSILFHFFVFFPLFRLFESHVPTIPRCHASRFVIRPHTLNYRRSIQLHMSSKKSQRSDEEKLFACNTREYVSAWLFRYGAGKSENNPLSLSLSRSLPFFFSFLRARVAIVRSRKRSCVFVHTRSRSYACVHPRVKKSVGRRQRIPRVSSLSFSCFFFFCIELSNTLSFYSITFYLFCSITIDVFSSNITLIESN